jgi:hypothetical protein
VKALGDFCPDYIYQGDYSLIAYYLEDGDRVMKLLKFIFNFFFSFIYFPGSLISIAGYLFFTWRKPKYLTRFFNGFSVLYVLAYLAITIWAYFKFPLYYCWFA